MSKWRVRGYVQDSDEEEEDLDTVYPSSPPPTRTANEQRVPSARSTLSTQTISSQTRSSQPHNNQKRDQIRYDDLLQGVSSQSLGPNLHAPQASSVYDRRDRAAESPNPLETPDRPEAHAVSIDIGPSVEILDPLHLELLSSSSQSDDELQELPASTRRNVVYASPQRQTEVQVVIPQPPSAQRDSSTQINGRSFRTRKAIQLHPYLLEGERYRRECKQRGINPVVRVGSPSRRSGPVDAESQEQDFDPQLRGVSNSPPEILESTPAGRRPGHTAGSGHRPHASSGLKPRKPWAIQHAPDVSKAPSSSKRRKLIRGSAHSGISRISEHDFAFTTLDRDPGTKLSEDVWEVPHSPPYSSSPPVNESLSILRRPGRPVVTTPILNVPTPLNSSSIRNDDPLVTMLDSDSDTSSVGRTAGHRKASEEPSDSEPSATDSDASESQIKRVGKKIRGVLPASWLRLNQAAQRHKEHAKDRMIHVVSPRKPEAQRGVAQKIMKRTRSPRRDPASMTGFDDLIIISDESGDEASATLGGEAEVVRESAKAAFDIAAELDQRYAFDDVDDMENDRLDLFTLGGGTRKRKHQTRLTDGFVKSRKKTKTLDYPAKSSKQPSRIHPSKRQRPRPSGPAAHSLSILDMKPISSVPTQPLPQSIRLALRQARRRPDKARQSPHNKYIRLQTHHETEEATFPLQQWRNGVLKPAMDPRDTQRQPPDRLPLRDRIDNRQERLQGPRDLVLRRKMQARNRVLIPGLDRNGPAKLYTRIRALKRVPQHSSSFRAAQLEGLEADSGFISRRIAFERGLENVDQVYRFQSGVKQVSRNPQLLRFLADDDAVLPPLPTAEDVGDTHKRSSEAMTRVRKPKAPRKFRARRIDAEAREYRQPSEPTVLDQLHNVTWDTIVDETSQTLQGLGLFGTRYSTTFDIGPLAVGTYFATKTFIGSEEFRRSIQPECLHLDSSRGQYTIYHGHEEIECGAWNETVYSKLSEWSHDIWLCADSRTLTGVELIAAMGRALGATAGLLRSTNTFLSAHLSFSDTIDRRDFVSRMLQLLQFLFDKISQAHTTLFSCGESEALSVHQSLRALTYLLVLSHQVRKIAKHSVVEVSTQTDTLTLMKSVFTTVVAYLVRKGVSGLGLYLEKNRSYREQENGIQDDEILVESVVICMNLTDDSTPGQMFWDAVSGELSRLAYNANQVRVLESIWAAVFTFLPYAELDSSGILVVHRRSTVQMGNWTFVKDILERLFQLYPGTVKSQQPSMNDYIRATLTRCHVLIDFWHWQRCDPVLIVTYTFFANHGLGQLRHEESKGSPVFLENLAHHPKFGVVPTDTAFQIFLKCLALGLKQMPMYYPEKKIRSIVSRCIPNHGRSYLKDQPLAREDLDALRNHHDLLCTLYWASPPACRPKVDLIRGLVHHEISHREACRLSVRTWTNLAAYQLSTDESYAALQPLAIWHQEIIYQTLEQYKLAKTEAGEFFESARRDGTTKVSEQMVRVTMNKNRKHIIATLRDCIVGMQTAIRASNGQAALRIFLTESGVTQLLEHARVGDSRLTVAIQETLAMLREFVVLKKGQSMQEVSQLTGEESQDYGDFPDLDDLGDSEQAASNSSSLEFVQTPLWRLLSNAFGAETAPDDCLLIDCIDTWIVIAGAQVAARERSWAYYLDTFSPVSWHQLPDKDQTRKFTPYFMASLIGCDSTIIEEHHRDLFTAWLVSLVERESMLRFQHRLTEVLARAQPHHPLLRNLPFLQDSRTGQLDITFDSLRTRRLGLLSSILANMRENLHRALHDDPSRVAEMKRGYASMLAGLMSAMKKNYQNLGHDTAKTVASVESTDAYVEFVQKVVQFLQQYTSDICSVDPFFTDSVYFPLPSTDPTYVVGRLCGYAPKLGKFGVAKELSVFIQTVAQQAALDNQQPYLVNQLSAALAGNNDHFFNKSVLRTVLLQGICPAYIEVAFESTTGMIIAKPILQSLKPILDALFFDVSVTDTSALRCTIQTLSTLLHAVIQATEDVTSGSVPLTQPHVLRAISLLLDITSSILPVLEYIQDRTRKRLKRLAAVTYVEDFCGFVTAAMDQMVPHTVPCFEGKSRSKNTYAELLAFSSRGLRDNIQTAWKQDRGRIFFGQGHRREVVLDLGNVEEEREGTRLAIKRFQEVLGNVYGDDGEDFSSRGFVRRLVV
ncbi:Mus7/MMS22 family-domain-containing protein [Clohesyomyces aquaticus]|uniref:Mus7/MMS22 family-domain-containing protein n=1 Tax=Clohesyomyces aquaticus TaxID=1231657 RepID=A0A1Y2A8C5_9PLEO|nr:Mus7/MMS22 family-domain-containing protein [Clohesyomyces aquaticus]